MLQASSNTCRWTAPLPVLHLLLTNRRSRKMYSPVCLCFTPTSSPSAQHFPALVSPHLLSIKLEGISCADLCILDDLQCQKQFQRVCSLT